jgi:3-dehydroquinate synthetase
VEAILARLGLPTSAAAGELAASWPFVASDKKRLGDEIRFPVVTEVGTCEIVRVKLDDLRRAALAQ